MSTEKWKIEKDLCRCCHSEGDFKSLGAPYLNEGSEEVYSDLLRDYLDLTITPMPNPLCLVTYAICDDCIQRLRDVKNFKEQVIACEKKFKDMYSRGVISGPETIYINIKAEPEEDLKEEFSNDEDAAELDINDDDNSEKNGDDDDDVLSKLKMNSEKLKKKTQANKTGKKRRPVGRPRKAKAAEQPAEDQEKPTESILKQRLTNFKHGKPLFRMQDTDYKIEGDVYICGHCNKKYTRKQSVHQHVKSKHYKILYRQKFICKHCSKELPTFSRLTIHKLEEHNVDERFKCNACDKVFNRKGQIWKHRNTFHMLGKKLFCDRCNFETFCTQSLRQHKAKHKTVKDHHCKYCKKSFLRKRNLICHEMIHTSDRRKICQVCDQAFVQKASLNYHMMKYHPEVKY